MNANRDPERIDTDFIIIGSGAAGLRAAVELASRGRVLILTKTEPAESNSRYAQGGIAAAMSEADSPELHFSDTLAAGAGLCDEAAVRVLAEEASGEIEKLIGWGTEFDREGGAVALGREGAHSQARVLHAHGDATGREIVRALSSTACRLSAVTIIPFAFVQELIVLDGRVAGVRFVRNDKNFEASASATLIASGGAGQTYRETTNPAVATGDGFVLGYRAGAMLRDMEFVQFHPTALKLPGYAPFLISEAVRGEGAYLIDDAGERFVNELAPRDVVARAIYERMAAGGNVYLDLRHLPAESMRRRFPHIYAFCLQAGLDITKQPAPVTPAAHYFMGGLYTDLLGRTSVPGLFAAGESASTGVHGANRLASNSLLECVVFGKRAATAMADEPRQLTPPQLPSRQTLACAGENASAAKAAIRETAWQRAGILRDARGLDSGIAALRGIESNWREVSDPSIEQIETANLLTVADLVLKSALAREESRGAHYRTDYPARRDQEFGFHSWVRRNREVVIGPKGD